MSKKGAFAGTLRTINGEALCALSRVFCRDSQQINAGILSLKIVKM